MGRKAFVNDLRDAALPGRFIQISAVTNGDDDGTIKFVFQSTAFSVEEIALDAMVSGTLLFHESSKYTQYHFGPQKYLNSCFVFD